MHDVCCRLAFVRRCCSSWLVFSWPAYTEFFVQVRENLQGLLEGCARNASPVSPKLEGNLFTGPSCHPDSGSVYEGPCLPGFVQGCCNSRVVLNAAAPEFQPPAGTACRAWKMGGCTWAEGCLQLESRLTGSCGSEQLPQQHLDASCTSDSRSGWHWRRGNKAGLDGHLGVICAPADIASRAKW